MPADNTAALHDAQRHHHTDLVARTRAAIVRLDRQRIPITFVAVARTAGVSRAFLYKTDEIRTEIDRLRALAASATTTPAKQRPSDASRDAVITRLRHDNHELRTRNHDLADQNAALLGQLRAGQTR